MFNCSFCDEIHFGIENTDIATILGDVIKNRIIYESKNFIVMPSIGAFIEGYLLIVSKRHYLSIAQLNSSQKTELQEVKELFKNILLRIYNKDILIFEHGSVSSMERSRKCISSSIERAGGCISHLHLNLLPISIDIEKEIDKHLYRKNIIMDYEGLTYYSSNNIPYILYEINGKQLVYEAKYLPSQFIRMIIGKKANIKDWNWRIFPNIKNLINTYDKVAYYNGVNIK